MRAHLLPWIAICAFSSLLIPVSALGTGRVERRGFIDSACNVRFKAPPDWTLSDQVSFPGIMVQGFHKKGTGRLSLAAERIVPHEKVLLEYSRRAAQTLQEAGYVLLPLRQDPSGAFVISGTSQNKEQHLWQGIRQNGELLYILTMSAEEKDAPRYTLTFADSLKRIEFPNNNVRMAACQAPKFHSGLSSTK